VVTTRSFVNGSHLGIAMLNPVFCFFVLATLAFVSFADVSDLTDQQDFDTLIGQRDDVWAVVFTSDKPSSEWTAAASKLKEAVRFGWVDCSRISPEFVQALRPCARFVKSPSKSGHALGYTFTSRGEREVSDKAFVGSSFAEAKIVKWALGLAPKLTVQLTAHKGTNIFHKQELSSFLKRPRISKAIFFTTSAKGDPPSLVTALAVRFRQRLLIGEVKASDMTLRSAFSVQSPPAIVVTDDGGKRHVFKGAFKRSSIEAFLETFQATSPDNRLHAGSGVKTEKVKVKNQQPGAKKRKPRSDL